MAIVAPIAVNNGAATPVAVTFNPEAQDNAGTYTFVDRTAGVSVGFKRLAVNSKFARGTARVNRSKLTLEMPVTSVVNGVTTQAYVIRGSLDLIFPVEATDAERKDAYAFMQNALSNTLVRGALRDLDPIYG
jgi:hypothetical protein